MKRNPTVIVFGDKDMPDPVNYKFYEGAKGTCLYYDRSCDGCLMTVRCSRRHKFLGDDCHVHCAVHGESGLGVLV